LEKIEKSSYSALSGAGTVTSKTKTLSAATIFPLFSGL
jgi:hypothetical protein